MNRKRTTIKDVSVLAGVSVSTVSRVLNASGPISQDTRKLVEAAATQLKYQPNPLARALVSRKLGGIGVLVPWIAGPFFGVFLEGIQQVLKETPYRLVVASGQSNRTTELQTLAYLLQNDADGVIYFGERLSAADLEEVNPAGKPLVVLGHDPEQTVHSIGIDEEMGAYLANRYLIDHGHTRIAHITGDPRTHVTRSKLSGYHRALKQAGVSCPDGLVVAADYTESGGYQAALKLLSGPSFTALFCGNDQMAMGAYQALRDFNLRIPEDVSVVGFDDILFSRYMHPALTTVRVPIFEMGAAAANTVLGLLNSTDKEVTPGFEPLLVVRHSVLNLKN
ncbi:LacI family DNA-binding transcriptional regulator [Deinococcus cellulosilyticus]|uniref:Transcriptional regulator GalR n=1 Tax=Deinococcus cellulosilyticus (strain DSM 18568 / NBRC 106333 / KACC 11606 / 5516J-15) TaxID=1223518 RepID=A0A511N9I2_DEIC1|nr:LacI family DNA-binding transcriptional regulator [Deinococcus cellulosilyticus]GEM49031.1 transcriptional regulator GalR [Deinococcus cellulosilyticus NBRC 106333 = KACC 11606]